MRSVVDYLVKTLPVLNDHPDLTDYLQSKHFFSVYCTLEFRDNVHDYSIKHRRPSPKSRSSTGVTDSVSIL